MTIIPMPFQSWALRINVFPTGPLSANPATNQPDTSPRAEVDFARPTRYGLLMQLFAPRFEHLGGSSRADDGRIPPQLNELLGLSPLGHGWVGHFVINTKRRALAAGIAGESSSPLDSVVRDSLSQASMRSFLLHTIIPNSARAPWGPFSTPLHSPQPQATLQAMPLPLATR